MYRHAAGQTPGGISEIRSAISGYCLDDHHDGPGANAEVDSWPCNNTPAQKWLVGSSAITHQGRCLTVLPSQVVALNRCDGSKNQEWAIDLGGFENPPTGLCLDVPQGKTGQQLIVASCTNLSNVSETWSADTWTNPDADLNCATGSQGQKVACYAQKQWLAWQSGAPNHAVLLRDYTDGNSYEQWCADFVSYVYREAGYPFSGGERDDWDEYDANNIQNMGFSMHPAGSYTPKPGDVAFFNYPGGHVEIVVRGGPHPTFIYGDSGTTDPQTGNGDMNEDMLTSDGSAGQVVYYLSPS